MARDLKVGIEVLEGFAMGRLKTMPPDVMHKVVAAIWVNGTTFDAERDLLVSGGKSTTKSLSSYTKEDCETPIKTEPVTSSFKLSDGKKQIAAKPVARPGWASA